MPGTLLGTGDKNLALLEPLSQETSASMIPYTCLGYKWKICIFLKKCEIAWPRGTGLWLLTHVFTSYDGKHGYLGPSWCFGAAFPNFLEPLIRHSSIQATQLLQGHVPHGSVVLWAFLPKFSHPTGFVTTVINKSMRGVVSVEENIAEMDNQRPRRDLWGMSTFSTKSRL